MMEKDAQDVLARMPSAQVLELHRLTLLYPQSAWHLNDCGCCVCLHPDGDDNSHGWVIGPDGDSEYVQPV